MDDLDVIRLVAMDNISKRSITREKGEVKENFRNGGGGAASGLPGLATGFSLVQGNSFPEKHLSCEKDAEGRDSR
jgi:hypothetical protein